MDGVGGGQQILAERSCEPGPHLLHCQRRRHAGSNELRCLEILNAEPLVALRRLAATAARALRVPERQPHLEREIRAQKVRKVGTVRANNEPNLVFAETQLIEQEIARSIA